MCSQQGRFNLYDEKNSQVVLVVKKLPANAEDIRCEFDSWVRKVPWRRVWQPIPEFLPGKSHGQDGQAGYCPWGGKRAGHDLTTK